MSFSRNGILGSCLSFFLAVSCAAVEWRHPLSSDGGGIWRRRIPITVTNPTDRAIKGAPVRIAFGAGGMPLAGMAAESVRGLRFPGPGVALCPHGFPGSACLAGPDPVRRVSSRFRWSAQPASRPYLLSISTTPPRVSYPISWRIARRWLMEILNRAPARRPPGGNMTNPTRRTGPPGQTSCRNRESTA